MRPRTREDPGFLKQPPRPANSGLVSSVNNDRSPDGWDLVVSYEGLFELAAYEPGRSGPFPR